ncbi:hypothetical protein B7P43_G05019 [Cryptotermes secundus]|uniref:Ionotropic glutamate receptor C-terminal domain-containing protein n=1 Tax=Cryptotermes secundus TaxID=105785 RepID=A0A2J7PQW9_9NEOP|nr:hypothetical protein B7P43_G05019 [Cryptotermes secundus]
MRRKLFLIFCEALLGVLTASNVFLTSEEEQLLSCVENVLTQHSSPGQNLVVSMPNDEQITNHRTLAPLNRHTSYLTVVGAFLKAINKRTMWPVLISRAYLESVNSFIPHKHHTYVIFVWPEEEKDINNTLGSQLENLKENFESFNRRGIFIIVAIGYEKLSPRNYAKQIVKLMWKGNKITDALVITPSEHRYASNSTSVNVYRKRSSPVFNLYTWSAYESKQCGHVDEVVLIDKWVVEENKGIFVKNARYSPSKSLQNLNGCNVIISTVHFPPSVIMIPNSTDTGRTQYRGVEMEYLLLLSEAMNMTLQFRPGIEGELLDQFARAISEVTHEDVSDIAIGNLMLDPIITSMGDPSIPYMFTSTEWFVPCPKPALRLEKIKAMFTTYVWLLIVLVFILMSVAFWAMARAPWQSIIINSNAYLSLLECLQVTWAILLSVSVPKLPQTHLLRMVFMTYVWYCFAINTVFQSYFISYLAQPGYGAQITTLKEMNESNLIIYNPDLAQQMIFYTSYETYNKIKMPSEISPNYSHSLMRLIRHGDVATLGLPLLTEYLLATEGIFGNYKQYVCTVDEHVVTTWLSIYFAKGNPLLNRVNALLRRCFESGLVDKYKSELMWNTRLENCHKSREHANEASEHMYFVFTLLHMRLAFLMLAAGYALSSLVFLAELVYETHTWR